MIAADVDPTAELMQMLAAQRAAFDLAFAEPAAPAEAELVSLLAIRIGGQRFALRMDQLSALQLRDRIVPLPGCALPLLGIVGVRGRVVAAYSLARLLGIGADAAPERWLALSAGGVEALGFAFAEFDGLRRVHRGDLRAAAGAALPAGNTLVLEMAELEEFALPVLHVPALAALAAVTAPSSFEQE